MKLTEILYEDVKDIWDGYLKHPFVSGIGDGSLSIERFRFYMLQDYLYLYDYARVYALGIVKSREPEMMQFFSQLVNDTLNGEMDIHRGYMARLGTAYFHSLLLMELSDDRRSTESNSGGR